MPLSGEARNNLALTGDTVEIVDEMKTDGRTSESSFSGGLLPADS